MNSYNKLKASLERSIQKTQADLAILSLIPSDVSVIGVSAASDLITYPFISVESKSLSVLEQLPPLPIQVKGGAIVPVESEMSETSVYQPVVWDGESSILGYLWYFTKLSDGSIAKVYIKGISTYPDCYGYKHMPVGHMYVIKLPVEGFYSESFDRSKKIEKDEADEVLSRAKVALKEITDKVREQPSKEGTSSDEMHEWISEWLSAIVSKQVNAPVKCRIYRYHGFQASPKNHIPLNIRVSYGQFHDSFTTHVNHFIDRENGFDWRVPPFLTFKYVESN